MSRTIDFLKEYESEVPSKFSENTEWRSENREWLKWSCEVALCWLSIWISSPAI